MDLSRLTDEDLQALSSNNIAGLSDEGLSYLASFRPIPPDPERSWGEAITDVPFQLSAGGGNLVQSVGGLTQLLSGGQAGQGLRQTGEMMSDWARARYSDPLQGKQARQQQQIEQARQQGSEWSGGLKAFTTTLSDPALLLGAGLETAPSLLAGGVGGIATRAGVKALLVGASEKALASAGVAGAIGANAAIHGGDVGGETYDRVLEQALAQGMSQEQAEQIALEEGRDAAIKAATVSAGVQFVPGGRAIERAMFRPASGVVSRGLGPLTGRVGVGFAGESAAEGVEEGSGQLFSNIGAQRLDPTQETFEGVGQATGQGAAVGGLFGSVAGGVSARRDAALARQREELERMEAARRQREAAQAAAATEGGQTVIPGAQPQEQPTLTRAEELRQAAEREAERRNTAPDRRARSWTPEDVMQEKRGQLLEEIRSLERERNSIREAGDIEQAGELQKQVVSAYELYSDLGGMTPQQAEKNAAAIKQTATRIKKLEKQFDEADTPQKVDEAVRGISEARKELDELRARQSVFDEFQPPEGQMGLDFEGGEGRFLTAESLRPIGRSRVVRDLEGADLTDPTQRTRAREVIEGLEPATKRETNAAREELLQRIADIEAQEAQPQVAEEQSEQIATAPVEGSLAAELEPGQQAELPLDDAEGVFPRRESGVAEIQQTEAPPVGEQVPMFGPRGGITPAARRTAPARRTQDETVEQPVREAGVRGRQGVGAEPAPVEPSVDMDRQPAAPAAPEGDQTPATRGVGDGGRPAGGTPARARRESTALKETKDAVQEQEAAPVPTRERTGTGEGVGSEVPRKGKIARKGKAAQKAPQKREESKPVAERREPEEVDREAELIEQIDRAEAEFERAGARGDQITADAFERRRDRLQEELDDLRAVTRGKASGTTKPKTVRTKPDIVEATQGWEAAAPEPTPEPEAAVALKVDGTPEQVQNGKDHAKDLGGEVVFQDGEIGLVRGYSALSGAPVYSAFNGSRRTRVDIAAYTGDLFPPSELERLRAAKAVAEVQAEAKHASTPFLKFGDGPLFSSGVSAQMRGVISGWAKMLRLDGAQLYVTTLADAKANRDNFTGPHRVVGSATLDANERGSMRMMPDGSFYIVFDTKGPRSAVLELVAHEMGHLHERVVYRNAPIETKNQIQAEYRKWLSEQKGKTARELVDALRARGTARSTNVPDNLSAAQMSSYWTSFAEWYADQVSRWATTSDKPLGVVEQFFKRLADSLRKFFARVQNQGYLPNETFAQYLEAAHEAGPVAVDTRSEQARRRVDEGEDRRASGTPTSKADEIFARAGREFTEPVRKTLTDKIKDIAARHTPAKTLGKRVYDSVLQALDISHGLAEARRDARLTKDEEAAVEDAIKDGLLAQIGHRQASATNALEDGGIQRLPNGGMYVTATSKDYAGKKHRSLTEVKDIIDSMVRKYGESQAKMEAVINSALEGRRMVALYDYRDQELARAQAMEASKNAKTRKEGRELREEIEATKSHITRGEAEALTELFDAYPEVKEIEKIKNDIREMVADFAVESGNWSREFADGLLEAAEWVPFRREFTEDELLNRQSFAAHVGSKLQVNERMFKLKGSERPVDNILSNFERWATASIANAIRNDTTASLTQDAIRDGYARPVNKISDDRRKRTVRYYENGEERFAEFDTEVQAAMFNTGIASPEISGVLRLFNNIFRNSIIAMPTFSAKQLPMDIQEAIARTGLPPKHAYRIADYTMGAMYRFLRGEQSTVYKELRARGLAGPATDLAVLRGEELKEAFGSERLSKNAQTKLGGILGRLNKMGLRGAMYADNAVREGIVLAALDSGMSMDEATKLAADYINFRRTPGAAFLRKVAAYVPFFSAAMAALRASLMAIGGRGLAGQAKEEVIRNYLQNAAMLSALSVALAAASGEDEEYQNMSVEQRARQLTIPGMGGFGIPRRVTIDTLIPVAAETMFNQTLGEAKDGTAARTAIISMLGEVMMPMPEPVPAPIKTTLEQLTNYSFFTGNPLVGHYMAQREAHLQYTDGTSELAKLMGQAANVVGLGDAVSPVRIDHIVRGTFGSAGAGALMISNGLIGALTGRPMPTANDVMASIPGFTMPAAKEFNNAYKNDLYDLMKRVDRVVSTANQLKNQGRVDEYREYAMENQELLGLAPNLRRVSSQLSQIRKRIAFIRESDTMNRNEKGEEIRRLREIEKRYIKQLDVGGVRERAGL